LSVQSAQEVADARKPCSGPPSNEFPAMKRLLDRRQHSRPLPGTSPPDERANQGRPKLPMPVPSCYPSGNRVSEPHAPSVCEPARAGVPRSRPLTIPRPDDLRGRDRARHAQSARLEASGGRALLRHRQGVPWDWNPLGQTEASCKRRKTSCTRGRRRGCAYERTYAQTYARPAVFSAISPQIVMGRVGFEPTT
jgi:hypothetical protein